MSDLAFYYQTRHEAIWGLQPPGLPTRTGLASPWVGGGGVRVMPQKPLARTPVGAPLVEVLFQPNPGAPTTKRGIFSSKPRSSLTSSTGQSFSFLWVSVVPFPTLEAQGTWFIVHRKFALPVFSWCANRGPLKPSDYLSVVKPMVPKRAVPYYRPLFPRPLLQIESRLRKCKG